MPKRTTVGCLAAGLMLIAPLVRAQEAGQAAQPASVTTKVDELFAEWDKPDSPGCALAVIKDGRIVYKRGYGMANLDHDVPITPSTVFSVASVTKQFTAAAIALLAQQGKLSLYDEVRKYIPELPDFGTPITIRHLIHHTSGLRDWLWLAGAALPDDVLELVSRQKELNFRPGEKDLYSNPGYAVLGMIVERVSGQSLREFARANIFEPLGMKKTHFRDDPGEIVKNLAYGYEPTKGDGFRRMSLIIINPDAPPVAKARLPIRSSSACGGQVMALDENARRLAQVGENEPSLPCSNRSGECCRPLRLRRAIRSGGGVLPHAAAQRPLPLVTVAG